MAWTKILTLHEAIGSSKCSDTLGWHLSACAAAKYELPAASQLGVSEALR